MDDLVFTVYADEWDDDNRVRKGSLLYRRVFGVVIALYDPMRGSGSTQVGGQPVTHEVLTAARKRVIEAAMSKIDTDRSALAEALER